MEKRKTVPTPLDAFWQPIATCPSGDVIRFEPRLYRSNGQMDLEARIVISSGNYPRKATHWMPLPNPPKDDQ